MARILNHLTVVRDGMHNGFPSLAYWRDAYWLSFSKGERHAPSTANRGCLLVSTDRQRWLPAADTNLLGGSGGLRPLPVDDGTMAGLIATWQYSESKTRILQNMITFTTDGYRWAEPVPILPLKYSVFGIRQFQGQWYAMAYLHDGDRRELFLMVSPDLLQWEQRCRIGLPEDRVNESDIIFQPDGEAWVVARTKRPGDHAWFCTARPPYTQWEFIDLKTRIHAPKILLHQGKYYVAGRCLPSELGETAWPFGHSLCVWELTRGAVKPVLRIPAAGDCAYCGIIEDPRGRVCLAYYSMHAYYLGVLPPFAAVFPTAEPAHSKQAQLVPCANDIYFAEIELD
jgi:hypothetical protein